MKAVIYARFSSDRQREESVEGQIRECKEYAQRENISIVNIYIDRATSASKDTDKRLDFLRMIKDSEKGLFDAVLVWKLDRFARSRYDSAHYKHILKKSGVRVISATENISDSPEGIILESMLEGMAEYYSAELSKKIHRGQKENALKCRNNGGGIPMGFQLGADQRLEIDPITAPIVQEIYRRYADGEEIKDLLKDVTARGIRTSRNKVLSYAFFHRLLKNRKYLGEYKYQDVVIPGGIPAIIDTETFERVQRRMEKNRQTPAAKKARESYLLTTKLFCGHCGKMMIGESGTGRHNITYRYYKCASAKRKAGCSKKPVKKDVIETYVVEQARATLRSKKLLNRIADRILEIQDEENYTVKLLEKNLCENTKAINNLLDAIQAGIITASTKERLNQLEENKAELEGQILKEKLAAHTVTREQIFSFLEQFIDADMTDDKSKQYLIDCFINSVYVYDDKIVLNFNYKNGSKTVSLDELTSSGSTLSGVSGSDLAGLSPP